MYNNYNITVRSGFGKSQAHMVKTQHYSKSLARGCNLVYSLYVSGQLVGVAAFGIPVGNRCQSKYSVTGKKVLELKRLVLDPSCVKNTGSWLLAKLVKDLKSTGMYDCILSYADPSTKRKHTGTIYKASNFQYIGLQKYQGSRTVMYKGKKYHTRSVYNKTSVIGKVIRKALADGITKVKQTPKKHIFVYRLANV